MLGVAVALWPELNAAHAPGSADRLLGMVAAGIVAVYLVMVVAAALGLALIAPDTSPRGANLPGDTESWDFGVGASFYLDATRAPWSLNYRMESYITAELLPLLTHTLPLHPGRIGIFGHSMGGRIALEIYRQAPQRVRRLALVSTGIHPVGPGEPAARAALSAEASQSAICASAIVREVSNPNSRLSRFTGLK